MKEESYSAKDLRLAIAYAIGVMCGRHNLHITKKQLKRDLKIHVAKVQDIITELKLSKKKNNLTPQGKEIK